MDTDEEKKETRTAEIELRTHEIATKTATTQALVMMVDVPEQAGLVFYRFSNT